MTSVLVEAEIEGPVDTVFFCGARVEVRFTRWAEQAPQDWRREGWLSARGICRTFGLDEEAELRGLRRRQCPKWTVRQAVLERGPGTTWRLRLVEDHDIFLAPSDYTNWLLGAVAGRDPEGRYARRLELFQAAYFDQLFRAAGRR